MSQYSQEILKVVVAKICQTIGWHSIQTTPLEIMVDILRRYLSEITKHTQSYATLFGHTQPNLDELGLAFRDLHINIADLEEYVRYVESSAPIESPMFPIPKESHLNFLKPGSGEVVTRPVHVNEHLPPMFKISEVEAELVAAQIKQEETSQPQPKTGSDQSNTIANGSNQSQSMAVFKRPADLSPNEPSIKRPRLVMEEEGRPTREISSVMMTTSGFLSPAREGKLPEARTPISAIEVAPPPLPPSPVIPTIAAAPPPPPSISQPPQVPPHHPILERKPREQKKFRKDKTSKELFKPDELTITPKKTQKPMKAIKHHSLMPLHPSLNPKRSPGKQKPQKQNKLQQPQNLTTQKPQPQPDKMDKMDKIVDGKLSSEPDKSKLNIFKKISKVKEEKPHKLKEEPEFRELREFRESRESSPDLIIDENHKQTPDITKASTPDIIKTSPQNTNEFLYDDDLSPPGTPSTPKTPEMPSHSPPQKQEKPEKPEKQEKEKRKRKDKPPKTKNKQPKISRNMLSPRRTFDPELERPKTPNDPINMVMMKDELMPLKSPVFNLFPGLLPSGPGLIPPPITNPLFPRLPLTGGLAKHGFGQPAHITPAMPVMPVMPVLPFVPVAAPPTGPTPKQPILDHVTIEKIPVQPEVKKEVTPIKEKHKKDKKDKPKKKNKKDKIKNKSEKRKLKEEKKDKTKKKDKKKDKEREQQQHEGSGSVPKLTLKIGSPRPPTPDVQIARKIPYALGKLDMIKPVVKKDEDQSPQTPSTNTLDKQREPSPELARISALITRPPKLKQSKDNQIKEEVAAAAGAGSNTSTQNTSPKEKDKSGPLPGRPRNNATHHQNNKQNPASVNNPPLAGVKVPTKQNKNVLLKQQQQQQQQQQEQQSSIVDNYGNKVWICPACGGQDDGSPMIGCDDCDAWYHWVCVGIQVPPDDNEDWYCRICIVKKQETIQMDKKKKRKKKERKEH